MFKEWPVLAQEDFESVAFSATKWTGGGYTAHIDFFKVQDNAQGQNEGMTLITQIYGETLKELHDNLDMLIDCGMLNCENLAAHGMLLNEEGDIIDTICWNVYADDADSEVATVSAPSTLQ